MYWEQSRAELLTERNGRQWFSLADFTVFRGFSGHPPCARHFRDGERRVHIFASFSGEIAGYGGARFFTMFKFLLDSELRIQQLFGVEGKKRNAILSDTGFTLATIFLHEVS